MGKFIDLKKLKKIADKKSDKEDASEALGTFKLNGKQKTWFRRFSGCLSFNANKIITTVGGAIITNNLKIVKSLFNI